MFQFAVVKTSDALLLIQMTDEPLERMMRDARLNMIGEGANEVMRAFVGLVGMRERALLLDGQLDIRSHRGAGTTIEVRLPFLNTASEAEDNI